MADGFPEFQAGLCGPLFGPPDKPAAGNLNLRVHGALPSTKFIVKLYNIARFNWFRNHRLERQTTTTAGYA
jgi:hypothetical protein